jgi:hypothetical protein
MTATLTRYAIPGATVTYMTADLPAEWAAFCEYENRCVDAALGLLRGDTADPTGAALAERVQAFREAELSARWDLVEALTTQAGAA